MNPNSFLNPWRFYDGGGYVRADWNFPNKLDHLCSSGAVSKYEVQAFKQDWTCTTKRVERSTLGLVMWGGKIVIQWCLEVCPLPAYSWRLPNLQNQPSSCWSAWDSCHQKLALKYLCLHNSSYARQDTLRPRNSAFNKLPIWLHRRCCWYWFSIGPSVSADRNTLMFPISTQPSVPQRK